jgi:hypothetical protein
VVPRLSRARKAPRDAVTRARTVELSWAGLRAEDGASLEFVVAMATTSGARATSKAHGLLRIRVLVSVIREYRYTS